MNIKAIALAFSMVFAVVSGQVFADQSPVAATATATKAVNTAVTTSTEATEANTTITTEAAAAGQEKANSVKAAIEVKTTKAVK